MWDFISFFDIIFNSVNPQIPQILVLATRSAANLPG